MNSDIRLTDKAQREMEERFRLERRAVALLGIIAAEFQSDPTSVQCFDLRIVRESMATVERLRNLTPAWELMSDGDNGGSA